MIVYLYEKKHFSLRTATRDAQRRAVLGREDIARLQIKQRFVAYTFQVFRFDIEVSLAGLRQRAQFIISSRYNNALLPFQLQFSTFG